MPTDGRLPPIPESMVERQMREAMERGEFEGLPGAGKPIDGLDRPYDPGWWARSWLRRERLLDEAREVRGEALARDRRLRAEGRDEEADRLMAETDRELRRINRMLPPSDRVGRLRRPD